jgi:hypothetical protein
LRAHARRSSAAPACACRAPLGCGDRRRGHTHVRPSAARVGRGHARRRIAAAPAGRVVRLCGRSRRGGSGRVDRCIAVAWGDERMAHSAAEPTAQRAARSCGGSGRRRSRSSNAAGCFAPNGSAAPCSTWLARISSRLTTGTMPTRRSRCRRRASGPRSRARTAIRCSTSRSAWEWGTASSRWEWDRATARPWRGRWSVARVWSWPSAWTRQRSRSPARTSTGPAIPTWSSFTGDGGLGHAERAPYDRICVTAACPNVPPPLIEQLAARGRLIAPVKQGTRQLLTLLEKTPADVRRQVLTDVLYVSLRGRYGVRGHRQGWGTRRRPRPVLRRQGAGASRGSSKSAMRWPISCDLCYVRARITGVQRHSPDLGLPRRRLSEGRRVGSRVVPTTPVGHRTAGPSSDGRPDPAATPASCRVRATAVT